jgi:hypothetical protein
MMPLRLLQMISTRAEKSFHGTISLENFTEWEKHWLVIARQLRAELNNSGAKDEVTEIDRILNWNERNQQLRKIISMKR